MSEISISALNEYLNLVQDKETLERTKNDGELYQKHHILPRSIYPMFKNCKWNIVLLTPSEHKFAHYLLTFITIGKCKQTMERSFKQYFC